MASEILRAFLYLLCAGTTFYAIFAIVAARDFFSSPAPAVDAAFHPGISILKPIRGAEPDAEENFRSFCEQDYPDYQIVFGALDPDDPGLAAARLAAARHAGADDRRRRGGRRGWKRGERRGWKRRQRRGRRESEGRQPRRHWSRARATQILLVSDSDVRAPSDYLRRMVAAFADPAVAVATSPYRSRGRGLGGLLQAPRQRNRVPAVGLRRAQGGGSALRSRRRDPDPARGAPSKSAASPRSRDSSPTI